MRSTAAARDAENRKGIPKLDSAGMGCPLALTKSGGGEHLEQSVLLLSTASTMLSSGVDSSLRRESSLPSSQATVMVSYVSERFTHRVVVSLAVTL